MSPELVRISRSQIEFLLGRKFVGQDRFIWVSRGRINELREFDESKHPRGQPENAGQFGPGGGGGDSEGATSAPAESEKPAKPLPASAYGFSKAEKSAIGEYISDSASVGSGEGIGGTNINQYMRDGKYGSDKKVDKVIDGLKSAMTKSETMAAGTVYRGLAESKFTRELRKNADKLIGQTVPLGGFQSTSADQEVAYDFISSYASRVMLQILVPAHTPILDMVPFAQNFAKQKEMLLGEGNLVITGVERGAGGKSAVLFISGTYQKK